MPALVPYLQTTPCLSQSALSPSHHIEKAMEKSGVMVAANAVHPPILVFRAMHGHLRMGNYVEHG